MDLVLYFFYAALTLTISRLLVKLILAVSYNMTRRRVTIEQYPKISVIVPAYNEEKTIGKCLQSLTQLDYPNYEVIVVDDGSKKER